MADSAPSTGQPVPQPPKLPPVSSLFWLGLTYMPLMARVSFSHTFNLAQTSPYNDLRSALTVAFIRAFIVPKEGKTNTFTRLQSQTLPKLPIKGRMWISQYTSPALSGSEADSVRGALGKVIESLNNPDVPTPTIHVPDIIPVYGEWTGYRPDAKPDEPQPNISEKQKYEELMKETRAPTTILYIHGGAHAFMDPATHRSMVKKLAKMSGGRAYSVRYRLVPQNPFPSSLLDCLVSYLTLLYPPPDSFHNSVKPEHIVIAGDSAGGNLTMALMQVIVELNRMGRRIMWHGKEREIPIPAASACGSPWLDIAHSSQPYYGRIPEAFDYLSHIGDMGRQGLEPCEIWPAKPPRKFMYAADDMMTHPLVSPVMRRDWAGFPPVYICAGWERLAYEDKWMSQKLWRDGVTVVFEEYEAMPHCFTLTLHNLAESRRCIDSWAAFIEQSVEDPRDLTSSSTTISAKTLKETPLSFNDLGDVSDETIRQRVMDTVATTKAWVPSESKL